MSEDPVFWEIGLTNDGKTILLNPQLANSYSYAGDNPITNKDPEGRIIDVALDMGFIGYDLYRIGASVFTGGNTKQEFKALGADVLGAVIPGATGLGLGVRAVGKGVDRLSNSAPVVRGGSKTTPDSFRIDTHPSGAKGFSVESSSQLDLCALCSNIPNNQVRTTTVGKIRELGGDVVPTSGKSSNHATVVNLSPQNANKVFSAPIKNPVSKDLRKN